MSLYDSGEAGSDPSSRLIPRMGQPGRNKWMFAALWLVYLIGPMIDVQAKHGDRSLAWRLLNWGLAGGFILGYCALSYTSYPRASGGIGMPAQGRGVQIPLIVALASVAAFTCLFVNRDFIGLWIYVSAGVGFSLPLRDGIALWSIPATVVALSLTCLITHYDLGTWFALALPTFFAGMATLGIRHMVNVIAELREARAAVARAATIEERLRLARDLHDLTGHSLSLITLKSELAQRMLERSLAGAAADGIEAPLMTKALTEIADIEKVSRQTLVDIREAVSNYRRPTLAVELSSACAALGAAEIKLDADPAVTEMSGTFDAEAEAVLAWCLREAVTNVIRHSGATKVRVRLAATGGEMVLSVQNNGCGLAAVSGNEGSPDAHLTGPGFDGGNETSNGLRGLRERLDSVNGRLTVGGKEGDFRLTAAVPVAKPGRPATP